MSGLVAVLVALAVVAAGGPPVRRPPEARRGRARGPRGRLTARLRGGWGPWRRRGAPSGPDTDLAGLLHAVAAQLRAGAPPSAAWAHVLGTAVDGQVPDVDVLIGSTGARGERSRARAVVAGARVASETGAPLADVLADLADAVAADAELAGDLEAALAGPRATARVLTLLPVIGLVVGTAMGAQPWRVLLDGRLGSGLAVTGVLLLAAGRGWVAALVRRAGAS
ncbi:type II secretion system F family protein [Cellulomonas sp. zg-ZUI22]|uniref:type II secretion system F family protein n=1 Tax=Cellulomonas sp. zg-ZUI22 TaxID=2816955 RepID=UPI001A951DC3|nr:type II secretion system F family protein [Cellulomonas sp. zg-ZUI22]MBO0899505.1 type II secretion system F family protein [Cellulomonas sp. zg-ZUI22]